MIAVSADRNTCRLCDYDLGGLGASDRCPKCGLMFGPDIVHLFPHRLLAWVCAFGLVSVFAFTGQMIGAAIIDGWTSSTSWRVLSDGCWMLFWWHGWRKSRAPSALSWLSVGPDEIAWRLGNNNTGRIRRIDIQRIEVKVIKLEVWLFTSSHIVRLPATFLAQSRPRRYFGVLIRDWWRRPVPAE
jgi:hypothetical protein